MTINLSTDLRDYVDNLILNRGHLSFNDLNTDEIDRINEFLFYHMGCQEKLEYLYDSNALDNLLINLSKLLLGNKLAVITLDAEFRQDIRFKFKDKIEFLLENRNSFFNSDDCQYGNLDE